MKTCFLKNMFFLGLVLGLAGVGCTFSLPKDLVKIDQTHECPPWSLDFVEELAPSFGHDTKTINLMCALNLIRSSLPAPIHSSASASKICFLLADRLTTDQSRSERFAAEGVRWAEIAATQGATEDGAVHYYHAVNLGIAVRAHTTLAVRHLKELIGHLEKAKRLTPDIDYGGPLRVLGMLYLLAPPWPQGIGDADKALALLTKAVQDHPDHPQNQMFFAQALWEVEEMNGQEQIQNHLILAFQLLNQDHWKLARQRWIVDLHHIAKTAGANCPLDQ